MMSETKRDFIWIIAVTGVLLISWFLMFVIDKF